MQHIIKIITLLLITPLTITAEQQPNPGPTFNNTPNITTSPTYNTNVYTTTTSTINAVGLQVRDITLNIVERAQKTFNKDNYHIAKSAIQKLLWEYRYNIAAYTLLGTYATTSMILLNDYNYLTNIDRWSHWKGNYNFEALCAIPRNTLEQELLQAIGEHHYNKKNPTDMNHPFIMFIETIEHEINTCKRYINITNAIKSLHVMKIMPTNDKKIRQINAALQRLLFIKHIFLSWLTERNLTCKAYKKHPLFKKLQKAH